MYREELYARVRQACRIEGMSVREASRVFGLDRKTVRKMLAFSVPPGYRRSAPPRRPKPDLLTGIIDRILEEDRSIHRKQRHTAKRIFDRLRDEYGFTGGNTNPILLATQAMGVEPATIYAGNMLLSRGLGLLDDDGELIPERAELAARALVKSVEIVCAHADLGDCPPARNLVQSSGCRHIGLQSGR